ncbi:MAG TPA: hypothetical protein VIV11_42570 [Kofleriaceae bacterium]
MRRALLCIGLAACGGGGGGGDDTGNGDGGSTVDAPPPETPLNERLTVSTVMAAGGVMAGDSNYRIWGSSSLRISPVFTVPMADCTTLVGYTTGTMPTARVAKLDKNDQLVTTFDLGSFEVRGLAGEPDGHFAALLWDGQQTLYVKRFAADGAPGWTASLDDPLAVPDDFNIGESRLAYNGGKYAAYYHVHGISGFANGHEGDQLKTVDAASGTVATRWQWGCSHSMSELLAPNGTDFLAACVTDCFPGTSGDFATNSIGGIYLDHDAKKVLNVDAACNGSVAGELGSLAPAASGWRLVFNAHQNPATPGSTSYSPSTMNQDIGFVAIAADRTPASVAWLTTTSVNEANASIARWQPVGDDREQYVVGWSQAMTYTLAQIAASGDELSKVEITGTAKWGERDDPFRVAPNGDIVWAWFDMAGATQFKIARLGTGAQCN